MRKIEKLMTDAIITHKPFFLNNTIVIQGNYGSRQYTRVLLHGHQIAFFGDQREVVTLAGWNTRTTKSRIRALLTSALSKPARIRSHKGLCQYMDTRQPDIWHDLPSTSYLVYDKMTKELSLFPSEHNCKAYQWADGTFHKRPSPLLCQ